jgi:hypothetical protein
MAPPRLGRKGGREGSKEGGREGSKEGGREGGRDRRREGGKEHGWSTERHEFIMPGKP